MTAVLDAESKTLSGVTPFDFVRGNVTVDPTVLAPEDWVALIDVAVSGVVIDHLHGLMPIQDILVRRYGGPKCADVRCHSVGAAVLKKTVSAAPPGARFLYCGSLSTSMNPRIRSEDLLFGRRFAKGSERTWQLYRLDVVWRWMRRPELPGSDERGFAATKIVLQALSQEETLDLFRKQDLHSVYLAGRSVLHLLNQTFAMTAREAEKYAQRVRECEWSIGRMLGRTGYGPFLNNH